MVGVSDKPPDAPPNPMYKVGDDARVEYKLTVYWRVGVEGLVAEVPRNTCKD